MLQIFQEATLPMLTEVPLFGVLDEGSNVKANIGAELSKLKDITVEKSVLQEMFNVIMFRGSPITRKAIEAYDKGDIIITFNREGSKIPQLIPYIVVGTNDSFKVIIFAEKVLSKMPSDETDNLMAVMEAAYLSLLFTRDPNMFTNNSQLMLSLCDIYANMATYPLESIKNIKGDNLNKIYVYIITYFYRMFRDDVSEANTPYKRIIVDKMDPIVVSQIVNEVNEKSPKSFHELLELMVKLNPVSPIYQNMPGYYIDAFFRACGIPVFALEYIPYIFLIIASSIHRTSGITMVGFNKHINMRCKKISMYLINLVNSY